MTMNIDMTQLEVVINSIINMNQKMQSMETNFQTKVESLQQENKSLYKKIEKLSETNECNEMEKEDKNSFINTLSRDVKTNEDNITILFENNESYDEAIERFDEAIERSDEAIKAIEESFVDIATFDEIIDDKIRINNEINDEFNNKNLEKRNENLAILNEKIAKLFHNCKIFKKQIEILFDNDK